MWPQNDTRIEAGQCMRPHRERTTVASAVPAWQAAYRQRRAKPARLCIAIAQLPRANATGGDAFAVSLRRSHSFRPLFSQIHKVSKRGMCRASQQADAPYTIVCRCRDDAASSLGGGREPKVQNPKSAAKRRRDKLRVTSLCRWAVQVQLSSVKPSHTQTLAWLAFTLGVVLVRTPVLAFCLAQGVRRPQ